jgi:hypothetical protein
MTFITSTGTTDTAGTFITTPTITIYRDNGDGTTDGVTYYRWDNQVSFEATSTWMFTVPALPGTHTLQAYSARSGALEETIRDLGAQFGLRPEDMNIDLGPLGKLV